MWPFKKKKPTFVKSFREDELESFIKELLCGYSTYEFRTMTQRVLFTFEGRHFQIQEDVLFWLNQPERKRTREIALHCICKQPDIMEPNCPVHGVESVIGD